MKRIFFVCGVLALTRVAIAADIGTAFTYQGSLEKPAGTPVTDTCAMRFGLWDDDDAGSQVGISPQTVSTVNVVNGIFTATIDFGDAAIDGTARWLAIEIKCTGEGDTSFVLLSPRVSLTPAPHALALPGLRTVQDILSPNIVGGFSGNIIGGASGATIAGGGFSGQENSITEDFGALGGGIANSVSGSAGVIAGGAANSAANEGSSVLGGANNAATGVYSAVAGGNFNQAGGDYSFAAGRHAKVRDAAAVGDADGDNGTFVWADSTNQDFMSTGANQFLIRAANGVGINTNSPTAALTIGGTPGIDGIRFPDLTVQTSAAVGDITGVSPGTGLTGGGSSGSVTLSIATGGVQSAQILDGTIATIDLATNSVDSRVIKDGAVSEIDLANNSVTSAKIVDGTITSDDLGAGSVSASAIHDGAVVATKLGLDCVASANLLSDQSSLFQVSGGAMRSVSAKIGIGTVPTNALSIAGSSDITGNLGVAGNIAIGVSSFPQQLSLSGGIAFANFNASDKKLYSPTDGTLEWMTHDNAATHGFAVSHQGTQRVYLSTNGNSFFTGGNVGIGTTTPGFLLEVNGSAGKPGGGSWSSTSDARVKKNVKTLIGTLDRLLHLRGVSFEFTDSASVHELPGVHVGMIAQEAENVFPDWVDEGPNGYKRITYRGFEALTVEALRDLHTEKDRQIAELREQKDRELEVLRHQVRELRQVVDTLVSTQEGGVR